MISGTWFWEGSSSSLWAALCSVIAMASWVDSDSIPEAPSHLALEGRELYNWARSRGASASAASRIVGLLNTPWMCTLPLPPRTHRKPGVQNYLWLRYLFRRHCQHILGWRERLEEDNPKGFGDRVNWIIRNRLYFEPPIIQSNVGDEGGCERSTASPVTIAGDAQATTEACDSSEGHYCSNRVRRQGRGCSWAGSGQLARADEGDDREASSSSNGYGAAFGAALRISFAAQGGSGDEGDHTFATESCGVGPNSTTGQPRACYECNSVIHMGEDLTCTREVLRIVCAAMGEPTTKLSECVPFARPTEFDYESPRITGSFAWSLHTEGTKMHRREDSSTDADKSVGGEKRGRISKHC